jgi:hypothetical protein
MVLMVSLMPAVFLPTTTSMFLSVLLQPDCEDTLTCCRSQQTLQFLPPSLLETFPFTETTTDTTLVICLK